MNEFLTSIKTCSLIENLSGIGTFITSLISLFTLYVIMKQRKDTFRPKIIFGDRLFAKCLTVSSNVLKTYWTYDYKSIIEDKPLCIELFNVGVGIAESVTLKEEFNYKKAIEFIKRIDLDKEFVIDIDKDTMTIKTTFDNSTIINSIKSEPRELGTFLPIKNDERNEYLFTDTFLSFLSCYDYLKSKNNQEISLDDFPLCKYEIVFLDLEGKKYKSKYECKVSSLLKDSYTFDFIKK